MRDLSKTNELIAEARRLPEQFKKVQFGETRYLEEDALAELDAAGYLAVDVARRLADALESATRVPEQGEASVAIGRVRAIIKHHIDWQLRLAEKFGRTKPDCVCEQCQIHAALDGAPEPVPSAKYACVVRERYGATRTDERKQNDA